MLVPKHLQEAQTRASHIAKGAERCVEQQRGKTPVGGLHGEVVCIMLRNCFYTLLLWALAYCGSTVLEPHHSGCP